MNYLMVLHQHSYNLIKRSHNSKQHDKNSKGMLPKYKCSITPICIKQFCDQGHESYQTNLPAQAVSDKKWTFIWEQWLTTNV